MPPATLHGGAALPDFAGRLRAGGAVRILAIGSSSTFGTGASSAASTYPALLEEDLRARWGSHEVEVTNAGIPGERAPATLARLEAALAQGGSDLVIWQVGTNDALSGADPATFRELLERGIGAVRRAGPALVLLNQQFYPGIRDLAAYERFVQAVDAAARAERVPVFSRYDLMLAWNERSPETLAAMLSPDGFHMGDRGYECLADLLAQALAPDAGVASASQGAPAMAAAAPALPTP